MFYKIVKAKHFILKIMKFLKQRYIKNIFFFFLKKKKEIKIKIFKRKYPKKKKKILT